MNTESTLPTILGYELQRELGRGGFATVYLARHITLDKLVAVKVMRATLARDREFSERFKGEARDTAKLGDHPNIVTVHNADCIDDVYYIAMQYLPGPHLKELLEEAQRDGKTLRDTEEPARRPLHVTACVARALAHAHEQDIVHRDVKPANILFDGGGEAVLSDFGIAKTLGGDTSVSSDGRIIGTPPYMSPEQFRGLGSLDQRTDLYSLGVVLFEMLTGTLPYRATDIVGYMYKHVHDPIPLLPRPVARYQRLIDRLMAKRPDERYASAEDLLTEIDSLVNPPPPDTSRKRRRRRLLIGAAALAGLAGAYSVLTPDPDEDWVPFDPEQVARLLDIGALAERFGNVPKAIEAYSQVLEMEPGNAIAKAGLERLEDTN